MLATKTNERNKIATITERIKMISKKEPSKVSNGKMNAYHSDVTNQYVQHFELNTYENDDFERNARQYYIYNDYQQTTLNGQSVLGVYKFHETRHTDRQTQY